VRAWGRNDAEGNLGNGTTRQCTAPLPSPLNCRASTPVQPLLHGVSDLAAGANLNTNATHESVRWALDRASARYHGQGGERTDDGEDVDGAQGIRSGARWRATAYPAMTMLNSLRGISDAPARARPTGSIPA
jgi:hypothetical protein